jgi:hypothetical protein
MTQKTEDVLITELAEETQSILEQHPGEDK